MPPVNCISQPGRKAVTGDFFSGAVSLELGKGKAEDERVGGHHWLNAREFEQAPGESEGQGSPAC